MENFEKTAVFPGGYGRIGEIPHGRIWPDWGLKGGPHWRVMNAFVLVMKDPPSTPPYLV